MIERVQTPEETTEHFKFLIEHFRKLAQDKDQVIITYREFLDKLKPIVEREEANLRKFSYMHQEIRQLRDELADLKRKTEKSKKSK